MWKSTNPLWGKANSLHYRFIQSNMSAIHKQTTNEKKPLNILSCLCYKRSQTSRTLFHWYFKFLLKQGTYFDFQKAEGNLHHNLLLIGLVDNVI